MDKGKSRGARKQLCATFLLALAALLCAGPAAGAPTQTLDRVVASVSGAAVTQSDVEWECRFEAFVNEGKVVACAPESAAFKQAESRLISQKLLRDQLSAYPVNSKAIQKAAGKQLDDVRRKFKSEADFETPLRALGMDSGGLLQYFENQQHVLVMIDERMRPAASVSSQDIQSYYQNVLAPGLRKSSQKVPSLAEVQDQIREILTEKKINQLLEGWLAELKREQHVETLSQ